MDANVLILAVACVITAFIGYFSGSHWEKEAKDKEIDLVMAHIERDIAWRENKWLKELLEAKLEELKGE